MWGVSDEDSDNGGACGVIQICCVVLTSFGDNDTVSRLVRDKLMSNGDDCGDNDNPDGL